MDSLQPSRLGDLISTQMWMKKLVIAAAGWFGSMGLEIYSIARV